MKAILLAALISIPSIATAQSWSAGMRTGIGCYNGTSYSKNVEGEKAHQYAWEKEAFLRYDTKKGLGFEVGLGQTTEKFNSVVDCGSIASSDVIQSGTNTRNHYYGLNLRAQYTLPSCPSMGNCPLMSRLSHSPGVVVAPTLIASETSDIYHHTTSDSYTSENIRNEKKLNIQVGIEDLIRYNINKHFDLQNLVGYRFNPGGTILRHGFTTQLGLAYRF
jgi:hypothetical protein